MILTPTGKKLIAYLFWGALGYAVFGPAGLAFVALVALVKEAGKQKTE